MKKIICFMFGHKFKKNGLLLDHPVVYDRLVCETCGGEKYEHNISESVKNGPLLSEVLFQRDTGDENCNREI